MNEITPQTVSTVYPLVGGNRFDASPDLNQTTSIVPTKMKTAPRLSRRVAALAVLLVPCAYMYAQTAAAPSPTAKTDEKDDVIVLSPFEVSVSKDEGYHAANTLAGNRLNTQLRDIGSAVSVVTSQFLRDTGAVNNVTLLQYTPSTEVGGPKGNFAGTGDGAQLFENTLRPNENTRVRGLAAADNTRDFFRTEIPWDSYNTDRVDLQRGPNSILFGQGSPAGIINAGTKGASFHNGGNVEVRYGSYGSTRGSLDINQVLVSDQVAFRIDSLYDDNEYRQDPAFSKDKRLSGAIRIEPDFLKKNGNHTIFKANFETGKIDSNNPRELPPVDTITPWFSAGVNQTPQETYIGWNAFDHLTGRPGHGAARENPSLYAESNPWIHNGFYAGLAPVAYFGNGNTPTALWITGVPAELQGHTLDSTGKNVAASLGGLAVAPGYMVGIATTSAWALNNKLPFSAGGIYKDNLLNDPSIFDFYNHLIDGNTKREWQRFHSATLNLTQTFLDEQVGFALDYNKEHYQNGQSSLLGSNTVLGIEVNKVFDDGTAAVGATPGVEPFSDGTPNTNLGRPYVTSFGGINNSWMSDREVKRATVFGTHDFSKTNKSWLGRILGSQTVTGLLSDDQQKTDYRTWQRYAYLDKGVYDAEQVPYDVTNFANSRVVPEQIIYLGGSLVGKSITGANIPSVAGNPTLTSGQLRYFNDHWKYGDPLAPGYTGVNPGDVWINYAYLPPANPADVGTSNDKRYQHQSDNPANYVGWTNTPLNVTDANTSLQNRDKLTTFAGLNKSVTTSQSLVWQGKMLDGSIIGTYGWRKDINKSWAHNEYLGTNTNPINSSINFDNYKLQPNYDNRVEVQSRAYSIVAHLSDLPGLKNLTKNLPFEVSLSYNVSTNFKPDASRTDVEGNPIGSPSGKTIDRGIQIETRDGRYSLKINRYVTSLKDATGTNSGQFGSNLGVFMNYANVWTNIFQYDIGDGYYSTAGDPAKWHQTGSPLRYNFATDAKSTPPEASNAATQADEAKAIAGMRAMQQEIDKALPNFFKAWGYQSLAYAQSGAPLPDQNTPHVPPGFTVTEDSVSKGWEIELSAQPTKNWRLTLNASKQDAVRSNIGGTPLNALMNILVKDLAGDAGQLHYWWGTADVGRAGDIFYTNLTGPPVGVDWSSRKLLENTKVPELRDWRVNLISNYDITTGALKGVNYGGAMRYQSSVTIGYPPTGDSLVPASYGYDLSNPYDGPSETNFDLWVGYSRKLTRRVNWHVQLNVQNVFKGDGLIPITMQPLSTGESRAAGYRIAPAETWTLTNRFEF